MSAKERPFYYVSDSHQLYAETSTGSGEFDLIYAGNVLACDWNFDSSTLALLCPDDARTGQHFRTDVQKSMIRLFKVVNGEVTDLIDEVETAVATCVMWAGDHFVVCSHPAGVTTVFELKASRLKLSVQDGGAFPFRALQGLGIINRDAQIITVWDLGKDKVIAKETLPNRHAKKGKMRAVCSTCATGNFSFVVNDDATFHAVYSTGRTLKLLKPMISIFSPDTRRAKSSAPSLPPVHDLISCALSATQVLIAAPGLPDVYRMRYDKKEQTLTVTEKAKVEDHDVILSLRNDRCLVKRTEEHRPSAYLVVPLDFHSLADRKRSSPAPAVASEPPSTVTAASTDVPRSLQPGEAADTEQDGCETQATPTSLFCGRPAVVGRGVIACAVAGIVGVLVARAVSK